MKDHDYEYLKCSCGKSIESNAFVRKALIINATAWRLQRELMHLVKVGPAYGGMSPEVESELKRIVREIRLLEPVV